MKFSDLPYRRLDQENIEQRLHALLDTLREAPDGPAALRAVREMNVIEREIHSQVSLCYIRHSVDTRDAFYKAEQDYIDEVLPAFLAARQKIQLALLASPHRAFLEAELGSHAFDLIELASRTVSEDVIEDLVTENKLSSEYARLLASAELPFDGKTLSIAQMGPYLEAAARETRKAAVDTVFGFYREHDDKLNDIFSELVRVRVRIADKLGFANFTELGYARMGRTDYDAGMVATYREQVKETIVPIAAALRERQRQRLGLDALRYYDEPLADPAGNPQPSGDAAQLLEAATAMFAALSPETDAFFSFMKASEAMDLVAKPGKEGGGYCTFLPNWHMPFIFANFNGTKGDVEVFTHEGGHAYQSYVTRDDEWHLYHEPGMETCEIHSMSMEFLTWPWMENFFGDDAARFRYLHLTEALLFIPYGVAVDHFQHLVYANPTATPAERNRFWLEVEAQYLPWRDYGEQAYLRAGNVWKRQSHIFSAPFYYIDYTLAQVMAFWFLQQAELDAAAAWQTYDRFCRDSGKRPFAALLKAHDMPNPFEAGSLKRFIPAVEKRLAELAAEA